MTFNKICFEKSIRLINFYFQLCYSNIWQATNKGEHFDKLEACVENFQDGC